MQDRQRRFEPAGNLDRMFQGMSRECREIEGAENVFDVDHGVTRSTALRSKTLASQEVENRLR
jgi:hypothetical protein